LKVKIAMCYAIVRLTVFTLLHEASAYIDCTRIRIGRCLYIVMESDLNPLSRCNILIKYADDTKLLVPGHTECTLTEEFTHICDLAQHNKMRIN